MTDEQNGCGFDGAPAALWADVVERVTLILALHDPVGAACSGYIDEYASEAVDIAVDLDHCHGVDEVQALVHSVFVRWFDVRDEEYDSYAAVARDLWVLINELT